MTTEEARLTPTEELVMEVLAARYRLGETLWTFDARHRKAIDRLAARGLVRPMHGTVEHTVRASLTDAGREGWVTSRYVPPIIQRLGSPEFAAEVTRDTIGTVADMTTRREVEAVLRIASSRIRPAAPSEGSES